MSNFSLGDFVARFNNALDHNFKVFEVHNNKISRQVIRILYKNGVISNFRILNDVIIIHAKYFRNNIKTFRLKIISKPSKKIYWSLNKLSLQFNYYSFSNFYIISTSQGLLSSNDCLFFRHISGVVLLQVKL